MDQILQSLTGAGGGSSGINYVNNPDFEINTAGWAAYADAAGASPVDGTGGSPDVTITRTTSSPLRKTASGLITKDAANRQGNGVSYDFTIDVAQKGRALSVLFDYIVGSGTFVAGDASSDGDITVYVYDVTNGVLIPLSDRKLYSNSSTLSSKFIGMFQTAPDSTSYRLILHCASTSASAYTLKIDEVQVAPLGSFPAAVVTDWQSYTPTFTGFGTVSTSNIRWRRNGENVEIVGTFESVSATGVEARLSLPNGLNSSSSISTLEFAGGTSGNGNAVAGRRLIPLIEPSKSYLTFGYDDNSTNVLSKTTGNAIASGTITLGINATVPIAGWGNAIQFAFSGDDGRVIVAKYFGVVSATASTSAPIQWNTKEYDTHNCVTTGSGWRFTSPLSAWYEYTAAFRQTSGNTYAYTYKNGVVYERLRFLANDVTSPVTGKIYLKAGEYFDIRTADSVTTATETECSIAIAKIGGSAVALGFAADMSLIPKAWGIFDGTTTGTFNPSVNKGIACSIERTAAGTYVVTLSKPVVNMAPDARAITTNDGAGAYGGHAACIVNSSTQFTIYTVEMRVGWSYCDANPVRFWVYGD